VSEPAVASLLQAVLFPLGIVAIVAGLFTVATDK
jgi:hypothetical protein